MQDVLYSAWGTVSYCTATVMLYCHAYCTHSAISVINMILILTHIAHSSPYPILQSVKPIESGWERSVMDPSVPTYFSFLIPHDMDYFAGYSLQCKLSMYTYFVNKFQTEFSIFFVSNIFDMCN